MYLSVPPADVNAAEVEATEKLLLLLLLSLKRQLTSEQRLSVSCAAFSTGHGTRKSIEGVVQDDQQCLSLRLLLSGLILVDRILSAGGAGVNLITAAAAPVWYGLRQRTGDRVLMRLPRDTGFGFY